MSDKWPQFTVFVVRDGQASGLRLNRRLSKESPEEAWYFWLPTPDGLRPTKEIIAACAGHHELLVSGHTAQFVGFVLRCATIIAETGCSRVTPDAAWKNHDGRDCQRLIDHFFERGDQQLRKFFGNASTFKKRVIAKVKAREELVGNAEKFQEISPHAVVVENHWFKPISHVLKVGEGIADWFRREGPIAADFDGGTVYRNEALLRALKNMVLSNGFSLLEGQSGTGKTVLVRELGYGLSSHEHIAVYWFDGVYEKGFNRHQLVDEINSASGVFIIEDVHLETSEYQRVYYSVRSDPNRHVLFTTRPSFRDHENTKDWRLSAIEHISIDDTHDTFPFQDSDQIIDMYARAHTETEWSPELRRSIQEVSTCSLWHLAYALEGCNKVRGKGEAQSWIAGGVQNDLSDLALSNSEFPVVLVALSPLYLTEVMTQELFLTDVIGVSENTLLELTRRDEIVKRTNSESGCASYGLHHTTLAELYWEYGKAFRRPRGVPSYGDFVCAYATSNVSNGLTAIISTDVKIRPWILVWLMRDENVLIDIVAREQDVSLIGRWCTEMEINGLFDGDFIANKRLLEILASKTAVASSLPNTCSFLSNIHCYMKSVFPMIWEMSDRAEVARKFSECEDLGLAAACLMLLLGPATPAATEVCEMLDLEELSRKLVRATDLQRACFFLAEVLRFNREKGLELWRVLDREKLMSRICPTIDEIDWCALGFLCNEDEIYRDIVEWVKAASL